MNLLNHNHVFYVTDFAITVVGKEFDVCEHREIGFTVNQVGVHHAVKFTSLIGVGSFYKHVVLQDYEQLTACRIEEASATLAADGRLFNTGTFFIFKFPFY